jgi:hypothetical protein
MEKGVVCPAVGVPVGAGVLVIGGNYNLFRDNWVYDNWKIGFVQTWVPGLSRGDNEFAAQEETSHHNRYLTNHMGVAPGGERLPNGIDYFWDGQGSGNCWQATGADVVEPMTLPVWRCRPARRRPQRARPVRRLRRLRPRDADAAGGMRLV